MAIGNYDPKNKVFLAPMLGVNCKAFLQLCQKYDCGLIYTQFYDTDEFDIEKLKNILDIKPLCVQLVGSKKENILSAMKQLDGKVDVIDINLGCPLPDQLGKKAGAYFMKHPEMISKVFKDILPQINTPVTAKIRSGWDEKSINAVDVCKIVEEVGFDAVCVHGRTRTQGYKGKNNWELIKECKNAVSIPVIGSGDITKPGHAKFYLEREYCDYVMIGRAAQKNPYFLKRCVELLESGINIPEKSNQEQFLEFYDLFVEDNPKLNQLKDHAIWFTSGLDNASELKRKILNANSIEDVKKIF